ncbi:Ribonuclease II/R [Venturia nashicola]|uniref:Ribonuclease II/R n=1 Tax=Venturia nashicola TaxID=86259 RepID=A0A4Z1NRZ5_9PEZI|nr:Ribonuclease II/R [Venturia nashicola]TLD23476.1 Ribonuclease II/R [Venturia nashicola]
MRHTRLLQSSNVCWSCLAHQKKRYFQTAASLSQAQLSTVTTPSNGLPPPSPRPQPIRKRLQEWQELNGNPLTELLALDHAQTLDSASWRQQLSEQPSEDDDGPDIDREGYELSYARGAVFEPGDLLELSPTMSDLSPPLCVFVRQVEAQIQLITSRGKWINVFPMRVMSSVSKFVDPDLIPPILPYLPSKAIEEEVLQQGAAIDINAPRTVTAPLVSALAKLKSDADEIYRHNAAILDSAHDILSHPTDLRFGSLTNIADKLLRTGPTPTLSQQYAVRKAIHHAGIGFYRDPISHRTTGLYQIRSKEHLQHIKVACEWLREYQESQISFATKFWTGQEWPGAEIVKGFIKKCRERILVSRKTRKPTHTGNVGPSSEKFEIKSTTGAFFNTPLGEPFTEEEIILVRFMEGWCVQNIYNPEPSLRALAPLLIRATGLYKDFELGNWTAFVFLQEIGVYDPWANRWLFDVNLLLPSSQHSKPLSRLAAELDKMRSRDVDWRDSMADLRHDWKDLPAFAIDPPGAKEIDDAVSVERIAGSSTEFWVHAHIANPTAFLDRNNVFAKMALHLTETLYLPEMVYPLLPAWMTQDMFSLRANRPCLTFSTKINLEGEILDTKVRPGIVRNVVSLQYNQLPDLLDTSSVTMPTPWSLVVGGEVPTRVSLPMPDVTPQQKEDLKLLFTIAKAHGAARARRGAVFFETGNTDCSVYYSDGFGLPPSFPHRRIGFLTHGDPIIELRGEACRNPFTSAERGSPFMLVQEMMTVANLCAATWCANRNIPILYRGVGTKSLRIVDGNKEILQPAREKYGFIPMAVGNQFLNIFGKAVLASKPIQHRMQSLDMYTKATSPLRRFGDMLAHWQIEAAIRQESRTGSMSLIGASECDQDSYLPFTRNLIDRMIIRVEPRERLITKMGRRAIEHWQCHAFQRAIEFGEAPLPKRAAVVIFGDYSNAETNVLGKLLDSSIKVQVRALGNQEAAKCMPLLKAGDVWECEYVAAAGMDSNIYFRPIQRIRQEMDPM